MCQQDTTSLWEVTNDLSKSEVKWSIASEDAKKSGKQKQGGPRYQDPGPPISSEIPDTHAGTPFPFGARVQAKFQATWYHGTIQGITSRGRLVLFDGYEAEGASEIALHLIRDLVPTEAASVSSNTERATPPQPTVNSTPQRDTGQFTANEQPHRDD